MRIAQIEAEEKKPLNELQIKLSRDEEAQKRRDVERKKIKPSKTTAQLPSFVEDDVDSYFCTFEKIPSQNEWPRDKWLAFLVPKLIGKANKIYVTLDAESDYDTVKTTILRAHSVTPDSYRQQFRNLKKGFERTHSEFTQELKRLFKKWMAVTNTKTFDELINLLELEQLKTRLPFFILWYIEEQREKGVLEAAGLVDAHHLLIQTFHGGNPKRLRTSSDAQDGSNKQKIGYAQSTGPKDCTSCRKPGHDIQNCKNLNCKASRQSDDNALSSAEPVLWINVPGVPNVFDSYKRQGCVSLSDVSTKCPVTILRDTVCTECRTSIYWREGSSVGPGIQSVLPNG